MYDEFERAVTGRDHEGLSFLGWLSVAVGTLFALGVVGVGLTAYYVHSHVSEIAEEVSQELVGSMAGGLEVDPTGAASAVVERLQAHAQLLATSPDQGLTLLQNLGAGPPSEAFVDRILGGSPGLFAGRQEFSLDPRGPQDGEGSESVEIHTGDGHVRLNLVRDDNGGSLVIDSDDGRVRFDLARTADGGFLSIDSEDENVRFDLERAEDGGSLIIRSDDGEVRFDVSHRDGGGTLLIRAGEESLRFGAGSAAEPIPGWVPRMDGMPVAPQPVYSLQASEGLLGAVSWQGDSSPEEVLSFYRGWLERAGFELKAARRERAGGEARCSLWARDQASQRVLFLVAEQETGEATRVLLGYGEGGD